ncbi:hypothetical protein BaRGS_00009151 [Batillaria attramentaria]|uniref:Uncharacterized protein n=1 Tax=Batillaria attramentaria TaxID=370345 RepID=A0ABD0LJ01_9CAEN
MERPLYSALNASWLNKPTAFANQRTLFHLQIYSSHEALKLFVICRSQGSLVELKPELPRQLNLLQFFPANWYLPALITSLGEFCWISAKEVELTDNVKVA